MNNYKLISKILNDMTKNRIDEEVRTLSYFLLFLSENYRANEYFITQLNNSENYEDFRMFFHKHLRQTDAFDSAYLEMTLHGFLNMNIMLLEDSLQFIYWLNKNHSEISDVDEAITNYYFDYDLGENQ